MNIIIATGAKPPYIAGIFDEWKKARDYMECKPSTVVGTTHVNSIETYPFYIVESNSEFFPFQDLLNAREFCCTQMNNCILYTVIEDFSPTQNWSDEMGKIPHTHMDANHDC